MMRSSVAVCFAALFLAAPAWAQDSTSIAQHGGHGAAHAPAATETAGAMAEYMAAMDKMHASMPEASGDAEVDFLRMMIPHHQSAVDMAQVVLENTQDEDLRSLAQTIIDSQEDEIAQMTRMLEERGAAR